MSQSWRLRGYVIERLLGRGGSGEVWRARVAATGEPVALKRLAPVENQQVRRIRSEAALLSALEHPNLIRLHAVVEDADTYVLVLDLADGGSLADLLTRRGCLTPGEVVTAVAPVAAALAYAHGQGVVHGDVSPANLLFTARGVPLLADLGVARLCGDDTEAESTPGYLDPAVAVGCLPGPASDVFMLGGVALHALTGRPTWPGRNAAELLAAARRGELGDVAERLVDAKVPVAMAQVITRALSSDALGRGSAADFALDLRQSVEPVAVELHAVRGPVQRRDAIVRGAREAATAGRPRAAGRHAAEALGQPPEFGGRLPWRSLTDDDELPDKPPPTAAVRPRPRPQLPRARQRTRRRTRRRSQRPRRSVAIRPVRRGAVVLGAALAIVLVALWARSRPAAQPGPVNRLHREVAAAVASTVPRRTGSAAPEAKLPPQVETSMPDSSPSASSSRPSRRARWAAVLATLDATRARAYATRNPGLLRAVYASPALTTADSRTLTRVVPRGCVLVGVRTSYRGLRVHVHGPAAVVSATASLQRSTLRCDGRQRASAPAAGPMRVRIVLERSRAGPRISQEWRSA